MDATRLAEIRARLEAVPAGPWWHDYRDHGIYAPHPDRDPKTAARVIVSGWGDAIAEFIAHSWQDITDLLAELAQPPLDDQGPKA